MCAHTHELTIPKNFAVSKTQVPASPSSPAETAGRRIQTRRSGVHGKGVYALQDLAEGETLIEYVGEIISWKEALRRHPHDPTSQRFFPADDLTNVFNQRFAFSQI